MNTLEGTTTVRTRRVRGGRRRRGNIEVMVPLQLLLPRTIVVAAL
jgi:hypothetical protein